MIKFLWEVSQFYRSWLDACVSCSGSSFKTQKSGVDFLFRGFPLMAPAFHAHRRDCFNDPRSKAVVLLATADTCDEGISLSGATHVVFIDPHYNPQKDEQVCLHACSLKMLPCL
jgi:hypothetical protein